MGKKVLTVAIGERCFTGQSDKDGQPIFEGDVLEEWYNQHFGAVRCRVLWDEGKSAYVSRGDFDSGAGWCSLNAEHFGECRRIASTYDDPDALYPAVKLPVPQHKKPDEWR